MRGRVLSGTADDPAPNPLRNARVAIVRLEESPQDSSPKGTSPQVVVTDADGRFEFTNVSAGQYTLTAAKSGYVKTTLADRAAPGRPVRVSVAEGSEVSGLEIRVPKAAAVAGRITDEFGDPVARALVTVETSPEESGRTRSLGRTTTDDLGDYRIGGLAATSIVVGASASSGIMVTMSVEGRTITAANPMNLAYYPGATDVKQAEQLTLAAGEERGSIDFTVSIKQQQIVAVGGAIGPVDSAFPPRDSGAAGAIRGRVLGAGGRPLPRAGVAVRSPAGGMQRFAATDDEGQYEFANLRPGTYAIRAGKDGYLPWEFGQRSFLEQGESIVLGVDEERERVEITLPRTSTISGQILDDQGDPVEGAVVHALQVRFMQGSRRLVDVPGADSRRTDDRGQYRISGLQPGGYIVGATSGQVEPLLAMDGSRLGDGSGYAPSYAPGTVNPAEARPIVVDVAQDVSNIDFPLTSVVTARITGSAHWSNGDPVMGPLKLFPSWRSSALVADAGARIEPDGSFEFPNLAPGEYAIQGYRGRLNSWTEGDFITARVSVNGADVTDLSLQPSAGSTITGRVTFDGGDDTPHPGDLDLVPFAADPDLSPPASGLAHAEIADDWTFRLAGINGPRRLGLLRAPTGWALEAVRVDGVDVTDMLLPFGTRQQSLKDVEVVLTRQLAQIVGQVNDDHGKPIARAAVIAFSPDRDQWYPDSRFFKRVTADNGRFAVVGLPPGDYCVAADPRLTVNDEDGWQDPALLDTLIAQSMRVTLSEGQTVPVILTVPTR